MFSLNLNGKLVSLETPLIMGILNSTPDSFYQESRTSTDATISARVKKMVSEGVDIIDVGGYSSRQDAVEVSTEEEKARLEKALGVIEREAPGVPVSVDTFRSEIARWAVEEHGVAMINDISGGTLDEKMFDTIAELQVAYVVMHMRGTPKTMQQLTHYEHLTEDIIEWFSHRLEQLHKKGVNDVLIDPGFGFAKTIEQNYELMNRLEDFHPLNCPLLIGISRKSMIYKSLGINPEEALNGTTMLNTVALMKGANILRVHDVREAVECVALYKQLRQ